MKSTQVKHSSRRARVWEVVVLVGSEPNEVV